MNESNVKPSMQVLGSSIAVGLIFSGLRHEVDFDAIEPALASKLCALGAVLHTAAGELADVALQLKQQEMGRN